MSRISNKNITQNVRRQSVGGFRNPPTGNKVETIKLPKAVEKRLKDSIITPEMYEESIKKRI